MEFPISNPESAGSRRVAVIDLGTNTFNLLIADVFTRNGELPSIAERNRGAKGHFKNVYNEKEGVALGMGGINKGFIAPDAFDRGVNALLKFKRICDEHQVSEIRTFGTSALRDAENADDFMLDVHARTGIHIHIISGEEEASLIYKGVQWSYDFEERAVIMDIGGGSTEFIVANQEGIEEKISLDIGVSRIFQELKLNDPLTAKDVEAIEQWLEERSQGFFTDKQCDVLVGASGSFETFHEMIHKERFPAGIEAREIPMIELHYILNWIIASEQAERDHHPFIIPIRRKMAPIAAVKTRWVMNQMLVKKVFVSPCSLKEGGLM